MGKISREEAPRLRGTAAVKNAIARFRRQCQAEDAVCWKCQTPIDYGPDVGDYGFEADHIYPLSEHPELAADPACPRPSHATCNRRRGKAAGKGPNGVDLGTTSADWENMTGPAISRRPGAARRKLPWYAEHDLNPEDDEALAGFNARPFAVDDDEPRFISGFGRRRSAYKQDEADAGDHTDESGDFDNGSCLSEPVVVTRTRVARAWPPGFRHAV